MNKDSIYKIIGYNGEYNASVKKAIRKLLKDNHPDNNGNRKIFELISEVKKELEENRVSFAYKKTNHKIKDNADIDYEYCHKMIHDISDRISVYKDELNRKNKKLVNTIDEYKEYYQNSLDLEAYLLSNSYYMNRLKSVKVLSIVLISIATIMFIISVLTKNFLFLGIFIILALICVIIIYQAFLIMQKITDNNRIKVKRYVGINSKIRHNQKHQKELNEEINALNKKIRSLENDLRFYNNILK
jgi:septal ring factor EnvC (AmiA/AmiB activator)